MRLKIPIPPQNDTAFDFDRTAAEFRVQSKIAKTESNVSKAKRVLLRFKKVCVEAAHNEVVLLLCARIKKKEESQGKCDDLRVIKLQLTQKIPLLENILVFFTKGLINAQPRFYHEKVDNSDLFARITGCIQPSGNGKVSDYKDSLERIKLLEPSLDGRKSLEKTLAERRSIREYNNEPITIQELSQLLWAAQGITDPRGFRTAQFYGCSLPT